MSHLGATADLLKVARATLREAVAPGLGAEARYHAAMVANAMAIAIREVELGPKTRAAERHLLGGFYASPETSLPELRARLCQELRVWRRPRRAAEGTARTAPAAGPRAARHQQPRLCHRG